MNYLVVPDIKKTPEKNWGEGRHIERGWESIRRSNLGQIEQ